VTISGRNKSQVEAEQDKTPIGVAVKKNHGAGKKGEQLYEGDRVIWGRKASSKRGVVGERQGS